MKLKLIFTSITCASVLSPLGLNKLTPSLIQKPNVEYDKVCYTKKMKITEYYLPKISGVVYSKNGYDCAFMVGKTKVFFKSSDYRKLKMEGFIQVTYETDDGIQHTVYIDHNKKIQQYPLDRKGNKLEYGHVACNTLPYGTEVIIEGEKFVVKDAGSALGNNQIDIFRKRFLNKTKENVVVTIYPPKV